MSTITPTRPLRTASAKARRAVRRPPVQSQHLQGLAAEQFFYFFLRLRKSEARRMVQKVQALYPGESPEQHARRLIGAQCSLAFVGGSVLHLPRLFPTLGTVWKFAGLVGGASLLTRMHLYLILEIALLYGEDIDDAARVPEMLAVVAATGLSAGTPLLASALDWHPAAAIPASGIAATAVAKLIGESAITFYRDRRAVNHDGVAPAMAAT